MTLRSFITTLGFLLLAMGCKGPAVEQQIAQIEQQFRQQVQHYFQELNNDATEMRDIEKPHYYRYTFREEDVDTASGEKMQNFVLLEATDPSRPFKARVRFERAIEVRDENTEPWLIETVEPPPRPKENEQKNQNNGAAPAGDPANPGATGEPAKEEEKPPPPPPPHLRYLYRKDRASIVIQDFIFEKGVLKPEGIVSETPTERWRKDIAPWKPEGRVKIKLDDKAK